ncbi:MAG: lamin tail domain-containing protein [Ferruginibacter sp.]
MKKIITLLLVLASMSGFSQSTTLVISQVYGAGGNAGALFNADYVELHNISGTSQSIAGFSIQYGSATGATFSGVSALPSVSIPAGGYYLIQMSTVGATGAALPTPDNIANPSIAMAAGAGKLALVNGTTAITVCNAANVIDFVGYGSTANCWEGTGPTGTLSATLAAFRGNNGCTETNDNTTDFTTAAPAPRNGASPVFNCGVPLPPTLSATALTAFGNVCINIVAGPNSFTITGSNLTNANVTVGALAGFTYSTTVAGTYTASLNLTQPGGAYSQQIFVRFTPTAVQSYNGNIAVGGGGAPSVNVAAAGSGINTVPSVTTGAATVITTNSATLAGSITANGCSAITAYGVEYSIVNGFPNGTGTAVASTNLAGGNFSSNVAGLTPGLTYYYHAYATNGGGTGYGTQNSFTTIALTPVITVTALTSFGNVCTNTTAGPNSFTINGTNLTAANISVGPLAGFTLSTTSGGTYTATLTLTQPGGNYTQQIFVKFSPVAIQSYNGTIPVTGAGAPATSVAAVGAGVNTAASVTSGAASAITQTSAILAGTIPSIGCSAVTAYGVEYSTTNGFPNGTGTAVPSANLTGINFSSALAGLTPGTTYYYHAYATNAGGTSYGVQLSFTTSAPVLTATPLTAFGANCINTTAGPNSFTINSNALLVANVNVGPLNGYSFSTTAGGTYTASLSLAHPAGAYTQTIYVKFNPIAVQSYNGNIGVSGGGAIAVNVAASGSGVNTTATIATGNATILSANSVVLDGSVSSIGCSPVTTYGIEYTGISGLANGLGTKVPSANLNSGNFSVPVSGLVQNATYYYKAYATNNGGIAYGPEKSFTTKGIPDGFVIYSSPIKRGGNLHYTYKGIKPGHYEIQIFNSVGQLVYQRELITQLNFIDDNFIVPGKLGTGAYSLHIVNPEFRDKKIFMIW